MPLGKDSILLTRGELAVPRIQIRPEVLGGSRLLLLMIFSRLKQQIYPISAPKICLGTLHTKPPAPAVPGCVGWCCAPVIPLLEPSLQLQRTGAHFYPFSCILDQGSAVPVVLHKDTLKLKELPQILSLFSQKPDFRQLSERLANCAGLFLPLSLTFPLARVLTHHHTPTPVPEAPTPLPWGLLPSS